MDTLSPVSSAGVRRVLLVAVSCVVVGLYLPGLHANLVFDDALLVGGSRLSGDVSELGELWGWELWESSSQGRDSVTHYYRPLFLTSLWLDHWLGGEQFILAHRVHSLIWHLFVVGLVGRLAQRLGIGSAGTTLAAVLVALHPVQVNAVQLVAARNDLMATAFVLSALLVGLRAGRDALVGVACLSLLALLSKESAMLMPVMLFVVVSARGQQTERESRGHQVLIASMLGVLIGLTVRWAAGVGFPSQMALGEVLRNAPGAILHWVQMATGLAESVPGFNLTWEPSRGWGLTGVVLCVVVAVVAAGGRLACGLAIGGGMLLAPALVGVAGNGLVSGHYLYAPLSLGALSIAVACQRIPPLASWSAVAVVAVLTAQATHRDLRHWRSDLTLWARAVAIHPQPYTFTGLGKALEEVGRLDEAAVFISRGATGAPPMPHACFNATRIHLHRGAPEAAAAAGMQALEAGCARSPELLAPMAVGLALNGDWVRAEAIAREIGLDPTGQAGLIRAAASARRGDLAVIAELASQGQGDPVDLRRQVVWVLQQAGEPAAAELVEQWSP